MLIICKKMTGIAGLVALILAVVVPTAWSATNNPVCDFSASALTESIGFLTGDVEATAPRFCLDSLGTTPEEQRCFYVYVPKCATENSPLVFDIHGSESCPQFSLFYTGWAQKATEHCFVVVWPTGTTDPEVSDNTCWIAPGGLDFASPANEGDTVETSQCCCFSEETNSFLDPSVTDDPTLMRKIAESVTTLMPIETGGTVTIDKKRIYMAGHSNGCIMGFGVAALESDMVAAVCCHAGYSSTPLASDYSPVPSFSIFVVKDSTILYEGASLGPQRYMGQVAQLTRLGDANGCNSNVVTTSIKDPTSGVEVGELLSRSECTDGADVSLLALYESGHTPFYNDGEDRTFLEEGETPTNYDTTQMAWEFCSQFEKAVEPDFSTVEDTKDATSNPTASPTSSGHGLSSRNASITGMTLIIMGLFGWALI